MNPTPMELAPRDDEAALAMICQAFGNASRPDHFTDFEHCEECAEHDSMFRQHTPDTVRRHHLGHPGWDPLTFITPEGFRYYMPALARLVLDRKDGSEYLEQFVDDLKETLFSCLDDMQRQALRQFLAYLRESRASEIRALLRPQQVLDQLASGIAALGGSQETPSQ